MSGETEQRTLSGGIADCGRTRPTTLLRCRKCDAYILRRERFAHEHDVSAASWAALDRLRGREVLDA
jgi:hypothetical protein